MAISDNNTLTCFFCGRDLSQAQNVNYVAEGPICSICLMQSKNENKKEEKDDLDQYDQILYG